MQNSKPQMENKGQKYKEQRKMGTKITNTE